MKKEGDIPEATAFEKYGVKSSKKSISNGLPRQSLAWSCLAMHIMSELFCASNTRVFPTPRVCTSVVFPFNNAWHYDCIEHVSACIYV